MRLAHSSPEALTRRTLLGLSGLVGAGAILAPEFLRPAHAASVAWSNPVLGPAPTTYSGHLGWDVAAAARTPIYAAADGEVVGVYNGCYRGHKVNHVIPYRTGNAVWLKHADGRYSYYGHFTVAAVKKGQVVSRGQFIGTVGNTGNTGGATGNHLHFEIHWGSAPSQKIDAKAFLADRKIALGGTTPVGSTGYPSTKQGAGGDTVRVLQHLLAGEGRSIAADGDFGSVTTGHVKAVQSKKGLYDDGVVGSWTWAAFTERLVATHSGHKVRALQQALNHRGAEVTVNGDFDSSTKAALVSFQKSTSLVGDGVCGPLTWSALV